MIDPRRLFELNHEMVGHLRQYARLGLDVASTSVSYAGDLLKDLSRHLKETGERLADAPPAGETAPPAPTA